MIPNEKQQAQKKTSPGLRLGLQVIRILTGKPGWIRFRDLQKLCGEPTSASLSRILKVLREEGWVSVSPKREGYRLGRIGVELEMGLRRHGFLREELRPVIRELAENSGESACYAEWTGDGFVFRVKWEQPDSYHHIDEGTLNRSYNNGYWQVLAAYQGERFIEDLVCRIYRCEKRRFVELKERFAQIRNRDVVCLREKGIRFLAPVREEAGDGRIRGVVGISLLPRPLDDEACRRYEKLVTAAARRIENFFREMELHS